MHHAREDERHDRLCELNVIEQVQNVCLTTIVRDAWARGQELTVHGWVYSLRNGLVSDMGVDVSAQDQLDELYKAAIKRVNGYGGDSPR